MIPLERPDRDAGSWRRLAQDQARAGCFQQALESYGAAYALAPDDHGVVSDLARLAQRLGMPDLSLDLHRHWLALDPASVEAAASLAGALAAVDRQGEAVALIEAVMKASPADARLWNALGVLRSQTGDHTAAIIAFDTALTLQGDLAAALANRAVAHLACGRLDDALADSDALEGRPLGPADSAAARLARASILLCHGRLSEGWQAYEARLDPASPGAMAFAIDARRWRPGMALRDSRLLLVAEQGLGDEIMFAGVTADLVEALGPGGALILAVEPRLVPLFHRAWPSLEVTHHTTVRIDGRDHRGVADVDLAGVDAWSPLASMCGLFRSSPERFGRAGPWLAADPHRVRYWRDWLSRWPGLKAGLIWKSRTMTGARRSRFAAFCDLEPLLRTPGATFVNLQYGDAGAEIAAAKGWGVRILEPPGIDLMNDLDDVGALCLALDLVIGFPTATTHIAAACGAPTWMICAHDAWPALGTQTYPWYRQARAFLPNGPDEGWPARIARAAAALAASCPPIAPRSRRRR